MSRSQATTYEVLPAVPADAEDPTALFCRCKVHGYYTQTDGQAISAPRLNAARWLAHNLVEVDLAVFAGRTNFLEASTDIVHWTALKTYAPTNGVFSFSDTDGLPRRFYRIRAQ